MAQDFVKKGTDSERTQSIRPTINVDSGNLSPYLKLCVGARVVLLRNIDVNDGIVNGSFGTVIAIKQSHLMVHFKVCS